MWPISFNIRETYDSQDSGLIQIDPNTPSHLYSHLYACHHASEGKRAEQMEYIFLL